MTTQITAEQLKALSPADTLALINKMAQDRAAADAARAEAEARAKAAQVKSNRLHCKVSERGALSVYGLQRFPVTFYAGQWERLIAFIPDIQTFLTTNKAQFTTKP